MTGHPICSDCEHFEPKENTYNKCDAFDKYPGIPWAIISGDNDHTEPYPGDNGIQFEPMPKE